MASTKYFGGWRKSVIAGVVILIGVLLPVGWRYSSQNSKSAPAAQEPSVPVTAATAKRQDVPEVIDTVGTVQSIDAISVQSQASGPIVKIAFNPGDEVKKGQELFLIDPRPYEAALQQVQAQLAHDQALLAQARVDLARYQKLKRENSIATQTEEDQAYVVQQDEASVQIDQANVKTAQINLGYTRIASPIDGRAGVIRVDLGNLVGPQNSGAASATGASAGASLTTNATSASTQAATSGGLVTITQMRPIYVNFSIPQTQLARVIRAQAQTPLAVEAHAQSGGLLAKGKLTVIDNQVNTATGSAAIQATFANDDEALWPGQFVSVVLVLSIRRGAVTVPAQAVMTGPDGAYVYAIASDQTVRREKVEEAERRNGTAVIEKGLDAGALVVVDGQYRLDNGVKVSVREGDMAAK